MPDKTVVFSSSLPPWPCPPAGKALGTDFRLLRFIDLLEAKSTIVEEKLRALGYIR
jgi:hypothetical protein